MLHWSMCSALYLPGDMVVGITVKSVTFYYMLVVEFNQLSGYLSVYTKLGQCALARPFRKRLPMSDWAYPYIPCRMKGKRHYHGGYV